MSNYCKTVPLCLQDLADRGMTRDGWKLGASACSLRTDVTYNAFVLPVRVCACMCCLYVWQIELFLMHVVLSVLSAA